jgi:uncharacterized protein YndB with AHSA1/START domain
MNGRHQLQRSRDIPVARSEIWAILEDSALLPRWAAVVESVACCASGLEAVGSVRECRVDFAGRKGTIVERCVELVPERKVAYVVDEDSLGFNRMFADYGFTITLEGAADHRTTVSVETYYTPRTMLTRALNALVMRRKLARTVDGLLEGLDRLATERAEQDRPRRTVSAA